VNTHVKTYMPFCVLIQSDMRVIGLLVTGAKNVSNKNCKQKRYIFFAHYTFFRHFYGLWADSCVEPTRKDCCVLRTFTSYFSDTSYSVAVRTNAVKENKFEM